MQTTDMYAGVQALGSEHRSKNRNEGCRMNNRLVTRPSRTTMIQAITEIVQADGPLPVAAIYHRLWNKGIQASRGDVIGALKSPQGLGVFASYPLPSNGGRIIRQHYYLINQRVSQ